MIAYIICCNDSIEAVVLDDEVKARLEMEKRKAELFDRCDTAWNDKTDYEMRVRWHIQARGVTQ